MCGIAGVVGFARVAQIDPAILRRMCAAMVHRGPDDEGIYFEGRAGLGVRRLSIIDLKTGHQPINNEDGTLWIVFNGEIYNHLVLRQQLIERGHRYRTNSDTETILHLYEEYGRDCVNHLRGMFAFAIWDSRQQRLFVARDPLGIKPLYYRIDPESFLFGSEIKVVLAHPGIKPEFNREVLSEYLAFGYLSGPDTFFSGIHKLMPGHILELDADGKASSRPLLGHSFKRAGSESNRQLLHRHLSRFARTGRPKPFDERCSPRSLPERRTGFQRCRRIHDEDQTGAGRNFFGWLRGIGFQRIAERAPGRKASEIRSSRGPGQLRRFL